MIAALQFIRKKKKDKTVILSKLLINYCEEAVFYRSSLTSEID